MLLVSGDTRWRTTSQTMEKNNATSLQINSVTATISAACDATIGQSVYQPSGSAVSLVSSGSESKQLVWGIRSRGDQEQLKDST